MTPEEYADKFTEQQIEHLEQLHTALLSGDYTQTDGMLQKRHKGHCCLGVACDISKVGEWNKELGYVADDLEGYGYPPSPVDQYFVPLDRLNNMTKYLEVETTLNYRRSSYEAKALITNAFSLSEINDHSDSFEPTADAIRRCIDRIKELRNP